MEVHFLTLFQVTKMAQAMLMPAQIQGIIGILSLRNWWYGAVLRQVTIAGLEPAPTDF